MAMLTKRPSWPLNTIGTIWLAGVVLAPTSSYGGATDLERVRQEYPSACTKLEQFYQQIQGTCVLKKVYPGRPSATSRMQFAIQGKNSKVTMFGKIPGKPPSPRELVYCLGSEGAFSVDRNPELVGDAWKLRSAGRDNSRHERANYEATLGLYLNFAFNADEVNMAEVATKGLDGLRLAAADPVLVDGRSCLRLLLERVDPTTGNHLAVTVDPEMGWAKRRVESFYKPGKNVYEVNASYDSGPGGMPLPRSVTSRAPDGSVKTMTFQSMSIDPTPAEAFTLVHYGLPAVDGRMVARQGRWPFWLGSVGVVGLVLAYLVRRKARAREARLGLA